ncbi:GNAT family N-acetyltransferase [Paenibacillus sp. CAA11]|uniref:GNAT family N-acetyltransferase n=1 Tax=Paenibacillus sp. CAA11 TaxID=1532905 RepID=UPI000D357AA2|nr:GNAT family N-acetyltransferase [Paenibacillus sp. CAA11]AWB42970.1 GNAT family N-acetyltransferase [Paenibacillus sp. CAA11]
MQLTLEKVETKDQVASLAQMAGEIWHEYYIRIISKEQIDYMVEKFQSVPAITQQMESDGYEYYFLNAGGTNVGYVGVKPEQDKLFLSKFYVLQAQRGNGYASQAMTLLVDMCKQRGLRAIWLTVNRHNDSTIAVYEKKGFKTVRTQVADIGGGFVMDDNIMEKTLV